MARSRATSSDSWAPTGRRPEWSSRTTSACRAPRERRPIRRAPTACASRAARSRRPTRSNGGTLQLTIDSQLEYQVDQAITKQAQTIGAPWATAVVVRVADGQLMAVADYPAVDPNDPGATPGANQGSLAFTQQYEPGSTFKGMSAAALIDAGRDHAAHPGDGAVGAAALQRWLDQGLVLRTASCTTRPPACSRTPRISASRSSPRTSTPRPATTTCSSSGSARRRLSTFPVRLSGSLPKPPWDPVTTKTVEFGQGVSATSVQVAQIYQTLANHGVREPLYARAEVHAREWHGRRHPHREAGARGQRQGG